MVVCPNLTGRRLVFGEVLISRIVISQGVLARLAADDDASRLGTRDLDPANQASCNRRYGQ